MTLDELDAQIMGLIRREVRVRHPEYNTLILGPGGFGFGDYWRLGLPLEILVVAVVVPMMLLVWPL